MSHRKYWGVCFIKRVSIDLYCEFVTTTKGGESPVHILLFSVGMRMEGLYRLNGQHSKVGLLLEEFKTSKLLLCAVCLEIALLNWKKRTSKLYNKTAG